MKRNIMCKYCRHDRDERFCMVCSEGDLYEQKHRETVYKYGGVYTDGTERIIVEGKNNKEYCRIRALRNAVNALYGYSCDKNLTAIENVIFNEPATIVFWDDGTKTVVKAQDDEIFDPEKGLAMAIAKKAFGNQGSYFNEIKKWVEPYEMETVDLPMVPSIEEASRRASEAFKRMGKALKK